MKIYLLISLFAIICPYIYPQDVLDTQINCIIFIDGKLPGGERLRGEFFVPQKAEVVDTMHFTYCIGEIWLSNENETKLNKLDPDQPIIMKIRYKPYTGTAKFYTGHLKAVDLRSRYLVIRITNLKKSTQEYYFGISTPKSSSVFIKEEYNMFD